MDPDLLEPELAEPYQRWREKPGPETNAAVLQALTPTIEGAIRTHVGEPNPLLTSRARLLALDGLRSYDPTRGRLQSHLYNQLQGLKRINRQQTQIIKVPERVSFDRYHLDRVSQDLAHELGREPTDAELADRTGFSLRRLTKLRAYAPGVAEGTLESTGLGQIYGSVQRAGPSGHSPWLDVVYDELDDHSRKVMELAFGLHGQRPLSNQEIAVRLKRSPGAISQAKKRIQALLDQEQDLSGLI